MSRQSERNVSYGTQTDGRKDHSYIERLSCDDEIAGDSNSIVNQNVCWRTTPPSRALLTASTIRTMVSAAPLVPRLETDAGQASKPGKLGVVLAKDMSCTGRDFLQAGFYTEVLFRQHNVCFIAIGNGAGSMDRNSSEFAPYLNIMNEWYLRNCYPEAVGRLSGKGKSRETGTNEAICGYIYKIRKISITG